MKLHAANMGPRRLKSANRELSQVLRELKLTGSGGEAPSVELARRFQSTKDKLERGGSLTKRERIQLSQLVAWSGAAHTALRPASGQSPEEMRHLLDLAFQRTGPPRTRLWWEMACHLWSDDRAAWINAHRPQKLHPRFTERRVPAMAKIGPEQSLPAALANHVAKQKAPIHTVSDQIGAPPESALADAVLRNLLKPNHQRWFNLQSLDDVEAFIETHNQADWVGQVLHLVLAPHAYRPNDRIDISAEPLHSKLLLADRWLPVSEDTREWDLLGEKCAQLVRWMRTQYSLEEFFKKWNAEPEREQFWKRFVRSIRQIEPYPRAGAIAMRIGDTWFAEVGKTGFATYAIEHTSDGKWGRVGIKKSWPALAPILKRQRTPDSFRRHCLDNIHSKRSHSAHGWETGYYRWIAELTGARPSDRPVRWGSGTTKLSFGARRKQAQARASKAKAAPASRPAPRPTPHRDVRPPTPKPYNASHAKPPKPTVEPTSSPDQATLSPGDRCPKCNIGTMKAQYGGLFLACSRRYQGGQCNYQWSARE